MWQCSGDAPGCLSQSDVGLNGLKDTLSTEQPLGALPTPTLQSQADESGRVRGGSPLRSSKIFQCLKMY